MCEIENEGIYYCIKCFNFYCNEHKNTHSINEGHYLISKNILGFNCAQHNNRNYISFCHNDKKNICDFCERDKHNKHKIKKYEIIEDNYLNDNKKKRMNYFYCLFEKRKFVNSLVFVDFYNFFSSFNTLLKFFNMSSLNIFFFNYFIYFFCYSF